MYAELMLPETGDSGGAVSIRSSDELAGWDPGYKRPYLNERNIPVVAVRTGRWVKNKKGQRVPEVRERRISNLIKQGHFESIYNVSSILPKDAWVKIDEAVYVAARDRLSAWSDLLARSSYGGFDAMSYLTLEYRAINDVGEAIQDMDGITDGRNFRPQTKQRSVPLPITHADFSFSARELKVAKRGGRPLDTILAEMAAARIAELIEKQTIGLEIGMEYGTVATGDYAHDGLSKVYGYLNHPNRIIKTDLNVPTGLNTQDTVEDVVEMKMLLQAKKFYGPYVLYYSTDWERYLDLPHAYHGAGTSWGISPAMTLRDALLKIEKIEAVKQLDLLNPTTNTNVHAFTLLLVQLSRDNVRAVNGMGLQTVMWESKGGMEVNFKLMMIAVTQWMSPYDGIPAVVQATTP